VDELTKYLTDVYLKNKIIVEHNQRPFKEEVAILMRVMFSKVVKIED
jgi:hypothetical protein